MFVVVSLTAASIGPTGCPSSRRLTAWDDVMDSVFSNDALDPAVRVAAVVTDLAA